MQFPRAAIIEQAVSKDKYRGAIAQVYLDVAQPEAPKLIATDGHILAIVPVVATPEEAGYVPIAALKHARKGKGEEGTLTLNGTANAVTGESWPREEATLRYPQWRAVLPAANREGSVKIGVDASLLHRLAQALGSDILTLELLPASPLSPIRVTVSGSDNTGVIMPVRIK